MNDDFMVLRPLSSADFHTGLFGPIFKLQDDLKVRVSSRSVSLWSKLTGEAHDSQVTGKATAKAGDSGEWGGLEWAAWVLNHRHPSTGLEYLNQ
jgi:hypothetical protein